MRREVRELLTIYYVPTHEVLSTHDDFHATEPFSVASEPVHEAGDATRDALQSAPIRSAPLLLRTGFSVAILAAAEAEAPNSTLSKP